MRRLRELMRDRRGTTAIEYALICALIFLSMVGAVNLFGAAVIRLLNHVSNDSVAVM